MNFFLSANAGGKRNSLESKVFFHKEQLAYFLNYINNLPFYESISPDFNNQQLPFTLKGGLSYECRQTSL
jgi:hypothetical protein